MASYRNSYWKTTIVAGLLTALGSAAVMAAIAAVAQSRLASAVARLGWALAFVATTGVTIWTGLVFVGAIIALHRDTLERKGMPYAAGKRREWLGGTGLLALWRAAQRVRLVGGPSQDRLDLCPGDFVQVKSLEEILATLDDRGALDGLPFMPEMVAHCGRPARVFRRVDKVHDWVHKTGLRRVHQTVLLEQLRCDGGAHGGCQTACHLRWKEKWLRRVGPGRPGTTRNGLGPEPAHHARLAEANLRFLTDSAPKSGDRQYVCQATELTAGTSPLAWSDPRHYLRDLVSGNVRLGPLVVGVAVTCFNRVQRSRGGVRFPVCIPGSAATTPEAAAPLQPGELVRVRSKREIEATLDSGFRNRGLWFDADMLRYCGGEYRVRTRVGRVIVEETGRLVELRNPCIILEGVTATGEYRAFNPENEFIFWRESWLERVPGKSASC